MQACPKHTASTSNSINKLAEMIFISPTNLVDEINFHLPNWNFQLPNFFLHFNTNFYVFVNCLLLASQIFSKKYFNVKKVDKVTKLFSN